MIKQIFILFCDEVINFEAFNIKTCKNWLFNQNISLQIKITKLCF